MHSFPSPINLVPHYLQYYLSKLNTNLVTWLFPHKRETTTLSMLGWVVEKKKIQTFLHDQGQPWRLRRPLTHVFPLLTHLAADLLMWDLPSFCLLTQYLNFSIAACTLYQTPHVRPLPSVRCEVIYVPRIPVIFLPYHTELCSWYLVIPWVSSSPSGFSIPMKSLRDLLRYDLCTACVYP